VAKILIINRKSTSSEVLFAMGLRKCPAGSRFATAVYKTGK
jgi:hypothetical protein